MKPGDRMFVVWNGFIRGWMTIESTNRIPDTFTCMSTGKAWKPGWYIQRGGPWHGIKTIPMKGFRGVRKANWDG